MTLGEGERQEVEQMVEEKITAQDARLYLIDRELREKIEGTNVRVVGLATHLNTLTRRVETGFAEVGGRLDRAEERIDRLGGRFDHLEARFDRFEAKVEARFDKVDERFDKVDERFDRLELKIDRLGDNRNN